MAMSSATLKTAMKAAIIANLGTWESVTLTDLNDPNYALEKWADEIAEAISSTVVAHITGFAKCSGADTHGDGHDAVGIV